MQFSLAEWGLHCIELFWKTHRSLRSPCLTLAVPVLALAMLLLRGIHLLRFRDLSDLTLCFRIVQARASREVRYAEWVE